jgi:DNA-binding MarR family transcriptional regulator
MFEHCIYFNTTSLARKLEREWTEAFRPFGLTPPQAFLLRMILSRPGSLQGDLAREMNISKATASRTLDGLVRLGFVRRAESSQDGRGVEVYPTEAATVICNDLNTASGSVTAKFKSLLGDADFEATVGKLRHIRELLD